MIKGRKLAPFEPPTRVAAATLHYKSKNPQPLAPPVASPLQSTLPYEKMFSSGTLLINPPPPQPAPGAGDTHPILDAFNPLGSSLMSPALSVPDPLDLAKSLLHQHGNHRTSSSLPGYIQQLSSSASSIQRSTTSAANDTAYLDTLQQEQQLQLLAMALTHLSNLGKTPVNSFNASSPVPMTTTAMPPTAIFDSSAMMKMLKKKSNQAIKAATHKKPLGNDKKIDHSHLGSTGKQLADEFLLKRYGVSTMAARLMQRVHPTAR